MSLRPAELRQIVLELSPALAGAVVQKAWCVGLGLCYLELRQVGRSSMLCLCAEPGLGRLSVTNKRIPGALTPPAFQQRLRRTLVGARLSKIELWTPSAARMAFERQGELSALVLEVDPRGGNLILLDGQASVIDLAVPAHASRILRRGAPYEPPEAPPESDAQPRFSPKPSAEFPWAEAAEAFYVDKHARQRVQALRQAAAAPLKTKLARTSRTLEKVRAEAARGPLAEEHRRLGEVLSRNLSRIPKGAKEARLLEYSAEGAREVVVPLHPQRSPKQEVEWHFHQYRRLSRGVEKATDRLRELTHEMEMARQQLTALERQTEEQLLEQVDPGAAPVVSTRAKPSTARAYKEYAASGGARVWVGKGAKQNDELTFRIARPQDVWVHARGIPGAHVVVPLQKGAFLSQEMLLDAAHLALHHSDAKGERAGEVSHTQIKYVRRQKEGSPGQVTYTHEKTFWVRVESERLERLLKSELP